MVDTWLDNILQRVYKGNNYSVFWNSTASKRRKYKHIGMFTGDAEGYVLYFDYFPQCQDLKKNTSCWHCYLLSILKSNISISMHLSKQNVQIIIMYDHMYLHIWSICIYTYDCIHTTWSFWFAHLIIWKWSFPTSVAIPWIFYKVSPQVSLVLSHAMQEQLVFHQNVFI